MNSKVRNITPTPSQTASRFLDALGAADFAELQSCLAPDVWLRALLPKSIHESQSAEEAAATFRDWYGGALRLERTLSETFTLGSREDADRAVRAARAAFPAFGTSAPAERVALMRRFIDIYRRRYEEIAQAITAEMGAPIAFSRDSQAVLGIGHMHTAVKVLESFRFREPRGFDEVVHEPIGV